MRVLIISDIHGNSVALNKVLESEKYDSIWFLGDLTDYGPDPDEVLDTLRDLKPEVWVTGNHDYANAFGVDCHCGEKTHELSVYTRENITMKKLSKEDRIFLRKLALYETKLIDGKKYYFVHACPSNPLYGYMYEPNDECMKNDLGVRVDAEMLVYGHTHFPVYATRDNYAIFNPGSVGQPRDGNPYASYGIYEGGEFRIKRVKYDVEEVVRRLKHLNLEERYTDFLIRILRNGKV